MSAAIHSLLADELDISDEKAEKLLSAMLREVRKRARQGEKGVRLPDLGKFVVEEGELAFYPTDSLKRAVNHRFEGLGSEDLSSAPTSGETDEDESEGPNTIRLGYQEAGWSPIDTEASEPPPAPAADDESTGASSTEDASTEDSSTESEEDGADTEEFQPPAAEPAEASASPDEDPASSAPPDSEDADETASDSPSTEELSTAPDEDDAPAAPDTSSAEPQSASEEAPDEGPGAADAPDSPGTTQTEELYPLVDEMGGGSSAEASDEPDASASSARDDGSDESVSENDGLYTDEERDALSKIWNDDADEEDDQDLDAVLEESTDTPESSDEPDEPEPPQADASDDEPETDAWDTVPTQESSSPSSHEDALNDQWEDASPEDAPPEDEREPPRPEEATSSSLPRILVSLLVLLLLGGGAWYILGQRGLVPSTGQTIAQFSSPSTATAPSDAAPSSNERDSSDPATDGTSTQDAPSSSEADASATTTAPEDGLDPAAGGWTVVVASRQDQGAAAELVETFRQRFADREVPVDVVEGTVDGGTRYRVGVGQFPSQIEAETFLDANGASLPDGAWPLELE